MRPHDDYKPAFAAVQRKIELAVRVQLLARTGRHVAADTRTRHAEREDHRRSTHPGQIRSVAALQPAPTAAYLTVYKAILAGNKQAEITADSGSRDPTRDYTEARPPAPGPAGPQSVGAPAVSRSSRSPRRVPGLLTWRAPRIALLCVAGRACRRG